MKRNSFKNHEIATNFKSDFTRAVVRPRRQPITLIFPNMFSYLKDSRGCTGRAREFNGRICAAIKREGQLRYNTKLFHPDNENKNSHFYWMEMIQSSAAARADNSYTLCSIKGADTLTKRRKKKEKPERTRSGRVWAATPVITTPTGAMRNTQTNTSPASKSRHGERFHPLKMMTERTKQPLFFCTDAA